MGPARWFNGYRCLCRTCGPWILSLDTRGGRRERAPSSCPLTSTYTVACAHIKCGLWRPPHTHHGGGRGLSQTDSRSAHSHHKVGRVHEAVSTELRLWEVPELSWKGCSVLLLSPYHTLHIYVSSSRVEWMEVMTSGHFSGFLPWVDCGHTKVLAMETFTTAVALNGFFFHSPRAVPWPQPLLYITLWSLSSSTCRECLQTPGHPHT